MVGHQITNLLASHMPHLAKTFPWKGKWWREWKTSYIDHGDDALTQQRRKWKCSDTQQFRSRKRKNDLCGKWEHGPDPVITNHAFGSCPCKLNSEGVAQVSLEMGGWRDEPSSWAELFWDNLQRLWIPQHLLLYSKMPSLPGWKFCLMTHALLCTKTPIAMSLWCCTW